MPEWGTPVRVEFRQVTRPWDSNLKIDERVTNDIKMGYLLTGTWPTPQNVK